MKARMDSPVTIVPDASQALQAPGKAGDREDPVPD